MPRKSWFIRKMWSDKFPLRIDGFGPKIGADLQFWCKGPTHRISFRKIVALLWYCVHTQTNWQTCFPLSYSALKLIPIVNFGVEVIYQSFKIVPFLSYRVQRNRTDRQTSAWRIWSKIWYALFYYFTMKLITVPLRFR